MHCTNTVLVRVYEYADPVRKLRNFRLNFVVKVSLSISFSTLITPVQIIKFVAVIVPLEKICEYHNTMAPIADSANDVSFIAK